VLPNVPFLPMVEVLRIHLIYMGSWVQHFRSLLKKCQWCWFAKYLYSGLVPRFGTFCEHHKHASIYYSSNLHQSLGKLHGTEHNFSFWPNQLSHATMTTYRVSVSEDILFCMIKIIIVLITMLMKFFQFSSPEFDGRRDKWPIDHPFTTRPT
jgi:hypothetical protein